MTQPMNKIPISVYEPVGTRPPGGPDLPTDRTLAGDWFKGWVTRRAEVGPEKLKENFTRFVTAMSAALEGVPEHIAGYQVEELQLEIEIGAEGELSLLGTGGKLSGKGGITLTLTRATAAESKVTNPSA